MTQIKLKITAKIDPFNHELKEGEDPVLVSEGSVLDVDSEDPFFKRYLALGWAEEVKEEDKPQTEQSTLETDEEEEDQV